MRPLAIALAAAFLASPVPGSSSPHTELAPILAREPAGRTVRLLDGAYPLEATTRFHAALFHWLDALSNLDGPGLTAGKTHEAYADEYVRRIGPLEPTERRLLERWRTLRIDAVSTSGDALTRAFFETDDASEALDRAAAILGRDRVARLTDILYHFVSLYRRVWENGHTAEGFLERALADERQRAELERFLVRMATFYGVEPEREAPPRLVLVAVPHGHGTHAQAIGRALLIEVRRGESLVQQIAPIVHENAHFLFNRIAPDRLLALDPVIRGAGAGNAFVVLHEALPTAIAQGVAQYRFDPERFSVSGRWYHRADVDVYAKRLYPLVTRALASDEVRFGPAFLGEALALWPGHELRRR